MVTLTLLKIFSVADSVYSQTVTNSCFLEKLGESSVKFNRTEVEGKNRFHKERSPAKHKICLYSDLKNDRKVAICEVLYSFHLHFVNYHNN